MLLDLCECSTCSSRGTHCLSVIQSLFILQIVRALLKLKVSIFRGVTSLKELRAYLKGYQKENILAPLFKLLEASFELLVPLVMASIIDVGIVQQRQGYIFGMSGLLVLLGVVGLAASITAQYFAAKAATGFAQAIRHAVFDKILSFSYSQLDIFGTDTLITRMTSDINQVQSGWNLFLRLLLRSPFVVFGAMVMAFTVDVNAAFIFVATIPLLALVIFLVMRYTIPLFRKVQERLDSLMTSIRENLVGVRVLRAFNREADERAVFHQTNRDLVHGQQIVSAISGLMNPLTYVIVNLAIVILLQTGSVKINSGILMQGQVIALVNYMSQILVELIKLANLTVQVTKAVASAERIATVLHTPEGMSEGGNIVEQTESTVAVEFKNVSLTYEGGSGEALENISFTVLTGQTVGIIGGTGSGKSSIIHLIPRFYDVSRGSVSVFGQDVRTYPTEQLRLKIGMVLQKAELFMGSIADNLRWGKADASEAEMKQALEIAQAWEYVAQKPGQLEYRIEQQGRNLSGGQKQRLTIARALVRQPDILILDDSASALDFATDAKLRQSIRQITPKVTTFIVSQRAASVQDADLILVMDEGRLVGQGSHQQLLAENKIYQEIYYSQFPKGGERS